MRVRFVPIVVGAALSAAAPALADFAVSVDYLNITSSRSIAYRVFDWSTVSPTTIVFTGNSVGAGIMNWNGAAGNAPGFVGPFTAMCVELSQTAPGGGFQSYTVTALENAAITNAVPVPQGQPMGLARAQAVARAIYAAVGNATTFAGLTQDQASALQISIWEIIYERTGEAYNVGTGFARFGRDFNANNTVNTALWSGVLSNAAIYLAAAANPDATMHAGVLGMSSLGFQDMVVLPAPGAAALLGLAGLSAARRRR
ncbi:MAG: hypothetical protein KIT68_04115 [Phycisphaeraceae bacterium]|nr:hypothetical protein [Phycisphaeraceae bacterium]